MGKLLKFAEQGFAVVSLLLYSGGPLTVILSGGANEGELEGDSGGGGMDSSLILVCFFINYLITFFLLILRWKKVLACIDKNRWLSALVAIAVFSVLWSYQPGKTINRGIAIVGTSLFGLYLATRYTMKQQLQLFGWMYGVAIVLSFVFIAALPKYGIMGGIHEGKWRGIYNHKNTLGKVIVPGIIIFLLQAIRPGKNILSWLGFILSLILLLRSTSTSSLLNFVMVLCAYFSYRIFRWCGDKMVPGLIATVTIGGSLYIFLSANTEALLGSLGKDATLTGRGDMWPYIFEMIWKSPWLGYGYGAFWSGPSTPSFYIWQATGWTPPNSHNGILDLWLNLGLLGLSIFILEFLVITLPRALIWVRISKTPEGFWPLLYMTYMLLANLSESTLMIQNDLFWVFYVAVAFSVIMPPDRPSKATQCRC